MKRLAFPAACCLLGLYAISLLSIGLTKDWRLMHEDNGALHTTMALSHLRLGLPVTKGHDLFYNPRTGEMVRYGHHPPGTALVLAAAFALTGKDTPAVTRLTPIFFNLATLFLLVALLARFFGRRAALFGGFVFATLPMSAFFGRMINYEPLTLTAVLVDLTAYAQFRQSRSRRSLVLLCLGIAFGGFIDWSSFFFAAAVALVEGVDLIRKRSQGPALFLTVCFCSLLVFLFDIWHLWFAGHGATGQFQKVLSLNHPVWGQDFSIITFILSQLETYRRYFTHAGLISGFLVTFSLLFPHRPLSRALLVDGMKDAILPVLRRLLVITLCAPTAYLLAAPSWAKAHAFWQFYFLPFAVLSLVLVARSLWRRTRQTRRLWPRLLLIGFLLEIAVTSAYLIHFRHSRPGGFAIEQTAMFRANYLTPDSWKGAGQIGAPERP